MSTGVIEEYRDPHYQLVLVLDYGPVGVPVGNMGSLGSPPFGYINRTRGATFITLFIAQMVKQIILKN